MIPRPVRRSLVSAALVGTLLATVACAGDDGGGDDRSPDGRDAGPTGGIEEIAGYFSDTRLPEPLTEVEIGLPEPKDGESEATAKVQVLSLDRDGDIVRLVGSWLRPTAGPSLGSHELTGGSNYFHKRPWIRLIDEQSEQVIEPLYSAETDVTSNDRKNTCLCSLTTSKGQAEGFDPKEIELFYADFPAPESGEVSIMLGEFLEPTAEVPVSEGRPFENSGEGVAEFDIRNDSGAPPAEYGAESAQRSVLPFVSRVRSVTGSSVSIEDEKTELSLPSDVLFDVDSSELDGDVEKVLDSAIDTLRTTAQGQDVVTAGHTDDQGEEAYNQTLSEERAETVRDYVEPELADAGITFSTEGFGETEPLAPNLTADGDPNEDNRALNRRVSFVYQSSGSGDLSVETGEELPEAPAMVEADAPEGALASAILEEPGDRGDTPLRIDLHEVVETGDRVRIGYSFALVDGEPIDRNFFYGTVQLTSHMHFGVNSFGIPKNPSSSNVTVVGTESGQQYWPMTGDGLSCLCTEAAGTRINAFTMSSPMYADYPKAAIEESDTVLRFADSGEWDLDLPSLVGQSAAEGGS